MNRAANDGVKLQPNIDTLPLFGSLEEKDGFLKLVAEAAGCRPEEILGHDLTLYVRQPGALLGAQEEYILSPKLDDLACVFASLEGFLAAKEAGSIPVLCVFDNEEVGSETMQGAGSMFLRDTLARAAQSLGMTEGELPRMLRESMLLSCDNAHAQHPNHPEFSDAGNCPQLNAGVALKFNANQRYATNGLSAALYRKLCQRAHARVQVYANRSDLPGGSTLGSIASTLVPVLMADIGLPQLAMHSCMETAGVEDLFELVNICRTHFESALEMAIRCSCCKRKSLSGKIQNRRLLPPIFALLRQSIVIRLRFLALRGRINAQNVRCEACLKSTKRSLARLLPGFERNRD